MNVALKTRDIVLLYSVSFGIFWGEDQHGPSGAQLRRVVIYNSGAGKTRLEVVFVARSETRLLDCEDIRASQEVLYIVCSEASSEHSIDGACLRGEVVDVDCGDSGGR